MKTKISLKILTLSKTGFHLLAKIKINNKLAYVIVDTGASTTVFDSKRVKKFIENKKINKTNVLSTGLGTNQMQSQITRLDKLRIGAIEIKNYKTVLLDLSHANESYNQAGLKAIDGVLGSDIFVKYKAIIDFEKKVLILHVVKKKKKWVEK